MNGDEPISILRAAERPVVTLLRNSGPWGVIAKQTAIGFVGVLVAGTFAGILGSGGLGLGVCCVAVPSAYFAWSSQRTMEPGRIAGQGLVKVVSTGGLIALVLVNDLVQPGWFFLGLLAGQGAYWWALVEKPNNNQS